MGPLKLSVGPRLPAVVGLAFAITACGDGGVPTGSGPSDTDVPAQPSGLTAVPLSDTEVQVSWTDNSSNEAGFVIERETVNEGAPTGPAAQASQIEAGRVGPNVTTFRDTGLSPGASYVYEVMACNDFGCSPGVDLAGGGGVVTTFSTLIIETVELAPALVDTEYVEVLLAVGGNGSYSWTVIDGSLPTGFALDSSSGEISGLATAPTVEDFTVQVASGDGQTTQQALTLTVVARPVLQPGELCTDYPDYAIATFEDANLEAAVRAALSIGAQEALTCALVATLRR